MDEKNELTLEDLKPNSDSKVEKKVKRNTEFAKTVIFFNIYFKKNPSSFTIRNLAEAIGLENSYAFQILDFFRRYGLVSKIYQGNRTLYIPKKKSTEYLDIAMNKLKENVS